MSEKLERCPFCGGEDDIEAVHTDVWWVTCHECGCEGPGSFKRRYEAIAAWNRRRPHDA